MIGNKMEWQLYFQRKFSIEKNQKIMEFQGYADHIWMVYGYEIFLSKFILMDYNELLKIQ